MVVVRSVQEKSCSFMEIQLMASLHRYVSFVSYKLVFKQFILKKTSILSVSCVLSSCGKSCSMCEIFTSSGCKYPLQNNGKKQGKILQSS